MELLFTLASLFYTRVLFIFIFIKKKTEEEVVTLDMIRKAHESKAFNETILSYT